MTFGYLADFSAGSQNPMGIRQHAESLLLNLRNNRQKTAKDRPLVFVGHSLGGLVAKAAIILSSRRSLDAAVFESTKLIVFLGTPHRGSNLVESTRFSLIEKMAKATSYEVPSNLKSALRPGSDELFAINDDFASLQPSIAIVNFYEQKPTQMKIMDALVVDKDSAVMHHENAENIPLHRDHRELIRFENANDDAYRQVYQTIQRHTSALLDAQVNKGSRGIISELMQICRRSLTFLGFENRVNEIAEPSEKTLDWLWEKDTSFMQWVTQGQGLYWISGKPGSGKSILMKEVSSRQQKDHSKKSVISACHFFNNRGGSLERSFEGFLRSILEQILRQEPVLFECMMDGFRQHYRQGGDNISWNIRSLKTALYDIIAKGSRIDIVYLFIDALDECSDMTVKALIGYFRNISQRSLKTKVKICFSSRNTSEDSLDIPGFVLQEKNTKDIINFVDDKWALAIPMEGESQDFVNLKEAIIEKADGVFLWVDLVLTKLEHGFESGNTISELRDSLNSIPKELDGLFGVLLDNIDPAISIAETNTMLSLVLCAARPLTLPEFRYATAFCGEMVFSSQSEMQASKNFVQNDAVMIKRIRSRGGGLLEVKVLADADDTSKDSSPTRIVQFIHQSVKDYLLLRKQKSESKVLGSDELMAYGHAKFSQACLQYLSINDLQSLSLRLEKLYYIDLAEKHQMFAREFPFLDYSVCYWIQHCQDAETFGSSQHEEMILFCQPNKPYFDLWCELHNWLNRPGDKTPEQSEASTWLKLLEPVEADFTPLELAVNHNLLEYVREEIEHGADVTEPLSIWGCYLQLAAFRGHEDMVKLLLHHGAKVNSWGGQFANPLVAACLMGHAGVVKTLLDWDADTSIGGMNPLMAAALSGKWEVIQLLLDHSEETFQNGLYRHMALFALSVGNFQRKGFAVGFEVDSDDELEFSENMIEFDDKKTDNGKVVDLLSARGVDSSFFGLYAPWYQWMMVAGSEGVVGKLLARDMNLDTRDGNGVSFLFLACLGGNGEAAQTLIENGANVEAYTKSGSTILHAAASNRSENVLIYLLGIGLDPNVADDAGRMPLHLAAARGSNAHLEALLSYHPDVTAVDSRGYTALHYAMSNVRLTNQTGILDALTSTGNDVNTPAWDGLMPLQIAARHGSLSTVQWLLDGGVDLTITDEEQRTALHAAAANNEDVTGSILDVLAQKGLDVSARDEAGMTPLHNVLYYRDSSRPGDQMDVRFSSSGTGSRGLSKLKGGGGAGALLNPASFSLFEFGKTQVAFSAQTCKTKIRLLLCRGADIDATDDFSNTSLHLACSYANRAVVKFLLDEGASKDVRNIRDCKPVDLAKREDVRALLEDD